MAGRLADTVYVRDPERHDTVRLDAGSEPEPRLAALVTNPAAWEGGKPPAAAKKTADTRTAKADTGDDSGTKQDARKASTSPARGRKAAGEGSSG